MRLQAIDSHLHYFTAAEAVNKERPSEPKKEGGEKEAPKPADLPDPKANQL